MTLQFLARDIAGRFHHRGALISPEHADVVADLREIAAADLAAQTAAFEARKTEILSNFGFDGARPPQTKPFAFADGVAVIPIQGLLINRLSWGSSFATGYNFIRSQLRAALDDPDVKGIVYDVNSYGGMAAGCGELAAEMFAARSEKPSVAVVDSMAYSGAYWLASAADRIVATPSGGVGSIGVVSMHVDMTEMLANEGIKITIIRAGERKVESNPFERLSPKAKAAIQQDVDYHYGRFTDSVAQNRDMAVEEIRKTEAACFTPPDALDIGLIDAIDTPMSAAGNFVSDIAGVSSMAKSAASWKCGASRDLSVKESGSWDGPAAAERMLDAAGFNGDNPDSAKARRGFLAYDAGNPKEKGSYKLPFADLVDGTLTAVRSGLNAAAQRLSGTDIPADTKREAQAVIDHYKPKDDKGSKSEEFNMGTPEFKAALDAAISERLKADRQRQRAIMTCDDAKGREKLAEHLAYNTEMSPDDAKAILASAPKQEATAKAGGNPLDAAMAATGGGAGVRPDASGGDGTATDDTPQARAAAMLGAWSHETGGKVIDITPNRSAAA
jgi:signal peptide peptidase SppA